MELVVVYLDGEIGFQAAASFRKEVERLKSAQTKTIKVVINCYGGLTGEARAIRQYLYTLRQQGIKIITEAVGYCDSAAILVFGAGNVRIVDKFNESFLVHEPRNTLDNYVTAEEAENFAKELQRTKQELALMYEEDFGMNTETALQLISEEKSLSPADVLKFGFATEIGTQVYNFCDIENKACNIVNVTPQEIADRRKEYRATVNMTYSELAAWAETECSKLAGNDRRPITRNLELLNINADDWTDKHYRWAGQTLAFIGRMKENLGGENVVTDKNGRECGTKAYISLKNWAYDADKPARTNNVSDIIIGVVGNYAQTLAPYFDDCLGYAREDMPQIDNDFVETFLTYFEARYGITSVKAYRLKVEQLKPAQRLDDLDIQKVEQMKLDPLTSKRLFIISQDGYLLDGHHAWAALILIDPEQKVQVVEVPLVAQMAILEAKTLKIVRTENNNFLWQN